MLRLLKRPAVLSVLIGLLVVAAAVAIAFVLTEFLYLLGTPTGEEST